MQTGRVKKPPKTELTEDWVQWSIPISDLVLQQIHAVDASEQLLERVTTKFAADEASGWTLSRQYVTQSNFDVLADELTREGTPLIAWNVFVGKHSLLRGPRFRPDIRQPITLKDADGQLTGGEIWIAADHDALQAKRSERLHPNCRSVE